MIDPATGLMLAGTAVEALGSILGGSSASDSARQQAIQAEQRAQYIKQKSDWEVAILEENLNRETAILDAQRAIEFGRQRREGKLLKGQTRASIGKAGVAMEGSPLAAFGAMAGQIEQDARALRFNDKVTRDAVARNTNLQIEAIRLSQKYGVESELSTADVYRQNASDSYTAGLIGAGLSLFSGVSSAYNYKKRVKLSSGG